ncbi:reverse transcriptase-like protein [Phosphitispora sp. TUW77]|uniref:reverse transcriptase-like protein n=1 Tax=Phosphitispora sp. TUW77 TaxID=3152361 RepID=UPI003AB36ECB
MNTLYIAVAGHARQNNGESGIGICYYNDPAGVPFYEEAEYLGIETQNSIVYHAIFRALSKAVEWKFKNVVILSDNRLVVGQLADNMSVRAHSIIPLHESVKKISKTFNSLKISYIKANNNQRPKQLAKAASAASLERITAQALNFEVYPGISGLILAFTPKMMLVRFNYKKGSKIGVHNHYHEQGSYIVQGALKYVVADQDIVMLKGAGLVVSSYANHEIEALEDTTEMVTYQPMRADLLEVSMNK